jgi:metal-responsive CopG/Arc/MetJ family transcriptional regulator
MKRLLAQLRQGFASREEIIRIERRYSEQARNFNSNMHEEFFIPVTFYPSKKRDCRDEMLRDTKEKCSWIKYLIENLLVNYF